MPDDSFNFNKHCEALLARYKRKNAKAVTRHLNGLCDILRREGEHVVQTKFGGSAQKGTYVTGLSDIDALLIVNQSTLKNKPPADVIEYVRKTIQRHLPDNHVSSGNLAVTIRYSDGSEIQILPAIRTKDGVRIADPGSTKWSNVAHPGRFAKELVKVNNANGGRVVPAIKLAKAMADCFITRRKRKISGYHMESLAIDAFNNYQDSLDTKSMLIHLLGYSIRAVESPIADSTGQSRYVDESLGPAGSKCRKRASTYFGQMRGKVKSCKTRKAFNDLFCIGHSVR